MLFGFCGGPPPPPPPPHYPFLFPCPLPCWCGQSVLFLCSSLCYSFFVESQRCLGPPLVLTSFYLNPDFMDVFFTPTSRVGRPLPPGSNPLFPHLAIMCPLSLFFHLFHPYSGSWFFFRLTEFHFCFNLFDTSPTGNCRSFCSPGSFF